MRRHAGAPARGALIVLLGLLMALAAALCVPAYATPPPTVPLKFGVITLNHPLMMYRQYLPFTDYLAEQSGVPIELVLAKDYSSIIDDLLKGEIDIALLGGLSYIEAREASPDIVPLCAVLSTDHTPTSRTVVFTLEQRKDIGSIKDLRGKAFAFASVHSTAGYLHPLCHLGEHGIQKKDFSRTENLRTHEAVVRSVLRKAFDAGAVSESTFRQFGGEGLKILTTTDPHPGFVLAARKGGLRTLDRLSNALLSLDYASPATRERARKWSPLLRNGFAPISDDDYLPIRTMRECAIKHGYRR